MIDGQVCVLTVTRTYGSSTAAQANPSTPTATYALPKEPTPVLFHLQLPATNVRTYYRPHSPCVTPWPISNLSIPAFRNRAAGSKRLENSSALCCRRRLTSSPLISHKPLAVRGSSSNSAKSTSPLNSTSSTHAERSDNTIAPFSSSWESRKASAGCHDSLHFLCRLRKKTSRPWLQRWTR